MLADTIKDKARSVCQGPCTFGGIFVVYDKQGELKKKTIIKIKSKQLFRLTFSYLWYLILLALAQEIPVLALKLDVLFWSVKPIPPFKNQNHFRFEQGPNRILLSILKIISICMLPIDISFYLQRNYSK